MTVGELRELHARFEALGVLSSPSRADFLALLSDAEWLLEEVTRREVRERADRGARPGTKRKPLGVRLSVVG